MGWSLGLQQTISLRPKKMELTGKIMNIFEDPTLKSTPSKIYFNYTTIHTNINKLNEYNTT